MLLLIPSRFQQSILARITLAVGLLAWGVNLQAADLPKLDEAFFEREVRPLLVETCLGCHGSKKQESGLRMDSQAAMVKGGDSGPAIQLESLEKSLILQAISYEGDIRMPPKGKLTPAQTDVLRKWVLSGAAWPASSVTVNSVRPGEITPEERKHWSFQPVQLPAVPEVKQGGWAKSDIDRFILAKLEANNLAPVEDATKRALLRRVTFDLIGLPPTPDEIAAFLADESPKAWKNVVDRLLASPHYGERWGRHWLDVARYADTAGDGADYPIREAYKYRNYVINALNADMPYDQFVREQIAGDILAAKSPDNPRFAEQVIATGFIAVTKRFGYNINTEFQHLDISDTLESTGRALMGLSIGCARCHDHKYEPITSKDYYALYGIFASSNYSFPGGEEYKKPHNLVPLVSPARVEALENDRKARLASIDADIVAQEGKRKAAVEAFTHGGGLDLAFEAQGLGGAPASPWFSAGPNNILAEAQSPFTHVHPAGSRGVRIGVGNVHDGIRQHFGPFKADNSSRLYFNIDLRNVEIKDRPGAYRLYWGHGALITLAIECSIDAKGLSIRNGDKFEFVAAMEPGTWINLQLDVDVAAKKFSGRVGKGEQATEFQDFAFHPQWDGVLDTFVSDGIGQSTGAFPTREIDNLAWTKEPLPRFGAAAVPAAASDAAKLQQLRDDLVKADEAIRALKAKRDAAAAATLYDVAYGMSEGKPVTARIQKRGEPLRLGDEVPRRFLDILGGDPLPAESSGSGRLELAEWIARPSNPLTARVMVNRVWQQHFGRGIVPSPSDFGIRGEPPSHPELLDYLAFTFMRDGWSLKRLHRQILLSHVYQLASKPAENTPVVDPHNAFCSYHTPQALDAESIRDAMLAISGKLDRKQPEGHPFPPVSQWTFTIHYPFHAVYESSHRSVYLMIQRSRKNPYLNLFDAADPNISTAERLPTITPTQALFLMNAPFVHEQAAAWVEVLKKTIPDETQRLKLAFVQATGSEPTEVELKDAQDFLQSYKQQLGDPSPAGELAAWNAYARVLLTSNGFLYVD